ncbi:MAG: OmpA family protein [Longimicrobiales bacterium]
MILDSLRSEAVGIPARFVPSRVVLSRSVLLRLAFPLFLLSGLSACVTSGTHEAVVADLDEARNVQEDLRTDLQDQRERTDSLAGAWAAEEARLQEEIARLEEELTGMEERWQRSSDRFEEAREEVYRLETILNERGSEYRQLQNRLESLRAIEREVRQRNQIYEEVIGRFQSLIDAQQLSVSIDRGRMVIQLPQDVLFPSGSATVGSDGGGTLREVGEALADLEDRQFQVEGHTDDVPISNERFASNWELSTARALSVVRLLVDAGADPENLSAAGYGEYQPVASNETPEGRRRNRRIEIVMLPNLDVIATTELPGN